MYRDTEYRVGYFKEKNNRHVSVSDNMNDEDFAVRSLFETWSNALNRLVSNVRDPVVNQEQYKTDLNVVQYAKDGEELRTYTIVGAFPTTIGAIALDWDSQNTLETFPVTFAYDYWVPSRETSSKKAGGINTYGDKAVANGLNPE